VLKMNYSKITNKNGFTLIELMIAMLIGMIVVAATITIYVITIKGSSDTMKSAQLNQDLGIAATIMTNDIRRAGYWGGAIVGADLTTNPFSDIQIYDFDGETDACIVYTYDENGDAILDANEYYGFRGNSNSIELKQSGSTTADCTGVWVDMIDSNVINVSPIRFTLTSVCAGTTLPCALASGATGVELRNIDISIDGFVSSDSSINTQISSLLKVRNNRVFTQP